jgi:hypothetical protein
MGHRNDHRTTLIEFSAATGPPAGRSVARPNRSDRENLPGPQRGSDPASGSDACGRPCRNGSSLAGSRCCGLGASARRRTVRQTPAMHGPTEVSSPGCDSARLPSVRRSDPSLCGSLRGTDLAMQQVPMAILATASSAGLRMWLRAVLERQPCVIRVHRLPKTDVRWRAKMTRFPERF